MAGKAAAAFLAGLGSGYMNAERQAQLDEERHRLQEMQQEEHDARMQQVRDQQSLQASLRDASRPVTVQEGAGGMTKPDTADNIDVGQPGDVGVESGGLTPGLSVAGRSFADRASAQASADSQNTPDAIQARQAAAYRAAGQPDKALTLEAAGMQVRKGRREEADAIWRDQLGQAMQSGFDGLASLMTNTEVGPFKGRKVQAVPSPDGKQVTFSLVNDDGSVTPTRFTFSNDPQGVAMAGFMMDRSVKPQDRVEFALKQSKEAREARLTDATIKKDEATARKEDATADYINRDKPVAGRGTGGQYRDLADSEKMRLKNAYGAEESAQKAYDSALEKLMPGDDPAKSPAVQNAVSRLRAAQEGRLKTEIQLGQRTNDEVAQLIMSKATNSQDVMKSLNQLRGIASQDFTDAVAGVIQSSPQWQSMTRGASTPQTSAGKAIANAPPGSVSLNAAGQYVPTTSAGAANAQPAVAPAAAAPAAVPLSAAGIPRDPNARATKVASRISSDQSAREKAEAAAIPLRRAEVAAAAAAAKTPMDAYRVMGMPEFDSLPEAEQRRLAQLVQSRS